MTDDTTTTTPDGRSFERPVGTPRVRTVFQDDESGHYRYRRHEVEISYEQPRDCWYIVVTAPNGVRAYDGWWYAGHGKTHREALMEALHGAMLWPNTPAETRQTAQKDTP